MKKERKNVVELSLFPKIVPDNVTVYQKGGVDGSKIRKMRDRSKYKRCDNCLFWQEDGTCQVMDIITDGQQSGCIDWRSKETGKR